LETHSEHLILRVLRRVKEGAQSTKGLTISNRDVSLIYIDPDSGGSSLHWIRIDQRGEFIDVWPSGFFVDRFEDIFFSSNE
jgi:predicted ATPase